MCFLYELHEYIEILKKKYDFDEKISDVIDNIENNLVDIYYNYKIYNFKEQLNTILSQLPSDASGTSSNKIFNEMKENIIDIYGINKKKKKEYYSYICDIKNITIE